MGTVFLMQTWYVCSVCLNQVLTLFEPSAVLEPSWLVCVQLSVRDISLPVSVLLFVTHHCIIGCMPPAQSDIPPEVDGRASERTVTVIGSELAGDAALSCGGEANEQELGTILEELRDLTLDPGTSAAAQVPCDDAIYTCIPALFVYGGMDTAGNIHSDCFLIVP